MVPSPGSVQRGAGSVVRPAKKFGEKVIDKTKKLDPIGNLINRIGKKGGIDYHNHTDAFGNKFQMRNNINKQWEKPGYNTVTKWIRQQNGLDKKGAKKDAKDPNRLLRVGVGLEQPSGKKNPWRTK